MFQRGPTFYSIPNTPFSDIICSNCQQFAIFPIKLCSQLHAYCGFCAVKIIKCENPGCDRDFIPDCYSVAYSQNHDRLLSCSNSDQGCRKELLATKLKDHLVVNCKYRRFSPVCCIFKGINSCNGQPYKMQDLHRHLVEVHDVFTIACDVNRNDDKIGRFTVLNTLNSWDEAGLLTLYGSRFDGNLFLRHRIYIRNGDRGGGIIYQWISILGDEKDAKKYKVKLKIQGNRMPLPPSVSETNDLTWNLSVVRGHDYDLGDLIFLDNNSAVAKISSEDLQLRCSQYEEPDTEITYRYSWTDEYEIIKTPILSSTLPSCFMCICKAFSLGIIIAAVMLAYVYVIEFVLHVQPIPVTV